MELMWKSDIGDKLPLTSEQRQVFQPRDGTAEDAALATHSSCRTMFRIKTGPLQPPQNCFVASLAPSAIVASLAHTTSESTAGWPTQVPKPQSLPAMTLSRPTRLA